MRTKVLVRVKKRARGDADVAATAMLFGLKSALPCCSHNCSSEERCFGILLLQQIAWSRTYSCSSLGSPHRFAGLDQFVWSGMLRKSNEGVNPDCSI